MDGEGGAMLLVAVPAAVLGAAGFGLASAAQQRATKEVELTPTLSPRLITRLLRRPMWLLGLLATVVALALQLVALSFGPITIVQPLLVTGVVFAAGFSDLIARRRTDPPILIAALCCAAGLAVFLLLARPLPALPDEEIDLPDGLPLAIALALTVVGCLAYAAGVRHHSRVLALALATGVLYGVTAGLMKVVTGQLRIGPDEPFRTPVLYIVCLVGPIGFLLSQNTFQQGRLVAPAVAVITSVDPVVSVLIGVWWLGERINSSPALLGGECAATLLVIVAIAYITIRGQHLADRADTGRHRPFRDVHLRLPRGEGG